MTSLPSDTSIPSPDPAPEPNSPVIDRARDGLRVLDRAHLTYLLDERGDIVSVTAVPEVPEHFGGGILKLYLERPGGLTLTRVRTEEFKQWLDMLPGHPVERGDTWDRVELVAIEPLLLATGQVFYLTKVYKYAGTVRQVR